jgi:AmmeMemoRadiSam system protein B
VEQASSSTYKMKPLIREAQFAGSFYPDSIEKIEKLLGSIINVEKDKIDTSLASKSIIGGIVPHAGYMYSGYQAIHFFELIKSSTTTFDTVVIINPNHTGFGKGIANLSSAQYWETPFGKIEIDREFSKTLSITSNSSAHKNEHSGEVQLPMLQYFLAYPFKVVLLTMNIQTPENAVFIAHELFKAQKISTKKILVLASSDFSHFESIEQGFEKDQHLIDQILRKDSKEVYQQVKKNNISACGYGPIMTLIEYSKLITQNPHFKLLRRGNSGDIHPSEKVVNYASFLCYE